MSALGRRGFLAHLLGGTALAGGAAVRPGEPERALVVAPPYCPRCGWQQLVPDDWRTRRTFALTCCNPQCGWQGVATVAWEAR